MKPIVLTGFMGCGKSTLGRLLAQRLGCQFVDLDGAIERQAGMTIPQIFDRQGEETFRLLETQKLKELLEDSSLVIATGGGAVLREENRALMLQKGVVVFLKAASDVIYQRISLNDRRPLAKGKSREEMAALYQSRMPFYQQCHICYEELDKTPLQCANELLLKLREEGYGD